MINTRRLNELYIASNVKYLSNETLKRIVRDIEFEVETAIHKELENIEEESI